MARRGDQGFDWLLIVLALLLCTAGALCVYGATRNALATQGANPYSYLERDLINVGVGVAAAFLIALVDYRSLRDLYLSPVLYTGSVVLLLAVLTPLGSRINGSRSWFSVGPQQVEPSELGKIALVLVLAAVLAEGLDRRTRPVLGRVAVALLLAGVMILLVLAEPALGVAIVLVVITIVMIAMAGTASRVVAVLLLACALAGAAVFQTHLLKPYQEKRFTALVHPSRDTGGTGYHAVQSLTAIGDGGLSGRGFLNGSQTNGQFVPEQQTDFIFTVAAEEGGFIGAGLLLAALAGLCLRGLKIASRAHDMFGFLIASGLVTWFAVQAFVNVGMTMGIMPVTGIPLPFVSYGGTATVADLIGVGLLLSITRHSRPAPPPRTSHSAQHSSRHRLLRRP